MEKFATITPSRDRPKMLRFCREQLKHQTLQPDASYFIAYDPTDSQPDLTKRIRSGIELAHRDGIDKIMCIEDDDAMDSDHLRVMANALDRADFAGYDSTTYYSLSSQSFRNEVHPGRSSLFCTGFRISALDKFQWPPDHFLWLDIKLFEYAKIYKKKVVLMSNNPNIGIKGHNEGIHAGKSHKLVFEHLDYEHLFLASKVEPYQLEFYKNWKV